MIVINRTRNQSTTFVQNSFSSTHETTLNKLISTQTTTTTTTTNSVSKCNKLFRRLITSKTRYYLNPFIFVNQINNETNLTIVNNGFLDKINIDINGNIKQKENILDFGARYGDYSVNILNIDELSNWVISYRFEDHINIWIDQKNDKYELSRLEYSYNKDFNYRWDGKASLLTILDDLNNDNQLDLIIINHQSFNYGILFGYWNQFFKKIVKIISTGNLVNILKSVVIDFNNDNKLDLIIYDSNKRIGILFGYGNESFEEPIISFVGLWNDFVIKDLNNDNISDIIGVDKNNFYLEIFIGIKNGSFKFDKRLFTGYKSYPHSIIIDHFNNDNQIDIAVTNQNLNSIGIFIGHQNGTFLLFTFVSILQEGPTSILANDINNDNRQDIIVFTGYYFTILLGMC